MPINSLYFNVLHRKVNWLKLKLLNLKLAYQSGNQPNRSRSDDVVDSGDQVELSR